MSNLFKPTMAILALVCGSNLASTAALGDETVTPLIKQAIGNGMEANILLVEVDPGFQTDRHLHPGDVFMYVLDGTVEIVLDGREPVRASAGEVVHEEKDTPMIGRNTSSTEGARLIIFQVGEAGKPLEVAQPN